MSALAVRSRLASREPLALWLVALDDHPALEDDLEDCLASGERRRAAQFLRGRDRRRFVVARASLRRLLAGELGCAASQVRIVIDGRGKPSIAGSELKLSVSRSEGAALFALSWDMEVGVDIEAIRPTAGIERIAARFFTAAEQRALASLPPERRRLAAFRCWVRKEAYAKGTGDGIASPLFGAIDIGVGGRREVGAWTVHDVGAPAGFVAAVAGLHTGAWRPADGELEPQAPALAALASRRLCRGASVYTRA